MMPQGYYRVRGGVVQAGDLIKVADGEFVGPEAIMRHRSAIGDPTVLYECVIRFGEVPKQEAKKPSAPKKRKASKKRKVS